MVGLWKSLWYKGKAKYYVLLEFDSVPICFEDLSSNVTDTFTNKKCSTQIWDNKTGNLETELYLIVGQTVTVILIALSSISLWTKLGL